MKQITPTAVFIEATTHCQLHCPSCPTASGLVAEKLGEGSLGFDDFKKILDENPKLKAIELSNYGEMFLNPQFLDIVEYAFRRKVRLTCDNGSNMNAIKPDVLEGLVKYRFFSLTCAIDGASPDTYVRYRMGGDFDQVIANVRRINELKKSYRSRFPYLRWQFIVFGHNQHEITAAEKMARKLEMEITFKLSWDPDFSPVTAVEEVSRRLGAASESEFKKKTGIEYTHRMCHGLWNRPVINWDGRVLGCCVNFWDDFGGNAFRDGLVPSVNNERIAYARQMLLGKKPERDDMPCLRCNLFDSMRKDGRWQNESDIRRLDRQRRIEDSAPVMALRHSRFGAAIMRTLLGKPLKRPVC